MCFNCNEFAEILETSGLQVPLDIDICRVKRF